MDDNNNIINIRRLVDLSNLSLWGSSITLILTAKTIPSQDYKNCSKPELSCEMREPFRKNWEKECVKHHQEAWGFLATVSCSVSKLYLESARLLLCLDYLSDCNERTVVWGFLWWRLF